MSRLQLEKGKRKGSRKPPIILLVSSMRYSAHLMNPNAHHHINPLEEYAPTMSAVSLAVPVLSQFLKIRIILFPYDNRPAQLYKGHGYIKNVHFRDAWGDSPLRAVPKRGGDSGMNN